MRSWITSLMYTTTHCRRLSLVLTMNSITIRGLQRLNQALCTMQDLQELFVDIRGNWMRSVGYGRELRRPRRSARRAMGRGGSSSWAPIDPCGVSIWRSERRAFSVGSMCGGAADGA